MSVASEQKFHDYIYLTYEDDDGRPLDDESGEVFWSQGRGGSGDVTYIRADRVTELIRDLRQYAANSGIDIDCWAWQELERVAGTNNRQGRFVFAGAAAKE